ITEEDMAYEEDDELVSKFNDLTIDELDPFVERTEESVRRIIISGLTKVMDEHAAKAMERMSKASST
ncbi:hypothetical protein H4R26_003984, partial [Coemansia thaxteri]